MSSESRAEDISKLMSELSRLQQENERLKQDKDFYTRTKAEWKVRAESAERELKALQQAASKLLEWCPVCSPGSSGYMRQEAVKALIVNGDGSLKQVVGVEADLKHPGNDTGGETVDSLRGELKALREQMRLAESKLLEFGLVREGAKGYVFNGRDGALGPEGGR